MRIDRFKLTILMMRKGINQKELAKIAGISVTTVGNIKNGKSCSSSVGRVIANALGVEVEELLENEKE